MKSETQRQVAYFDLDIASDTPGVVLPIDDLAQKIVERVESGDAWADIEGGRLHFRFLDARVCHTAAGQACLALLALCADKEGADPALWNSRAKVIKQLSKGEDDANASTAHIVIRLSPIRLGGITFPGLMEIANNVGQSRFRGHLAREIRTIINNEGWEVRRENKPPLKLKSKIALNLVANDKLKREANAGRIRSVVLYDTKASSKDFDPPEGMTPTRREMRLRLDGHDGESPLETLQRLKPWAKDQGFNKIYVQWERPQETAAEGLITDETASATIDLSLQDIGEMLFAKRVFVALEQKLGEAQSALHEELLTKMLVHVDRG